MSWKTANRHQRFSARFRVARGSPCIGSKSGHSTIPAKGLQFSYESDSSRCVAETGVESALAMKSENMQSVPGEEEWGQPTDIDERYTKKRFFGWSLQEAEHFFIENPYSACEELFYMPRPVFRFYLNAFKYSIRSRKHTIFERVCLPTSVVYCLEKSIEKEIPEVVDFVEVGRFVISNSRYFELNREFRMKIRMEIQNAQETIARVKNNHQGLFL